jgi:type IV secretory pathway VirB2 component (pilin)
MAVIDLIATGHTTIFGKRGGALVTPHIIIALVMPLFTHGDFVRLVASFVLLGISDSMLISVSRGSLGSPEST